MKVPSPLIAVWSWHLLVSSSREFHHCFPKSLIPLQHTSMSVYRVVGWFVKCC